MAASEEDTPGQKQGESDISGSTGAATETKAPEATTDTAEAAGAEAAQTKEVEPNAGETARTAEDTPAPADVAVAAGAEAVRPEPVQEAARVDKVVDESTYGIQVDPVASFSAAREVVRQMHITLSTLKRATAAASAEAASEESAGLASQLQLQLLALRRAHRGMAKAQEVGRAAEMQARRVADAEFAHLESRRYESGCSRSAARRCRAVPQPELARLRPFLDDGDQPDEAEDEDGEDIASMTTPLSKRLVAEQQQRQVLSEELEALQKRRAEDTEAFRKRDAVRVEMSSKLRAAQLALEPVCDLLELQPRAGAAPLPCAHLPQPLQLLFAKFKALAALTSAGDITVRHEQLEPEVGGGANKEEPPEKKARHGGGVICVGISRTPGLAAEPLETTLRFTCGLPSAGSSVALVGLEAQGVPNEIAFLDSLWPEDDALARASTSGGATAAGRIYGWVQVLAGLRDVALPLAAVGTGGGPLVAGASVSAAEVVGRARVRVSTGGTM